jgi:hypothetical protein
MNTYTFFIIYWLLEYACIFSWLSPFSHEYRATLKHIIIINIRYILPYISYIINIEYIDIMSYGLTVLEGEAKSVWYCLLDLPLDAGNITKVAEVRSVLWHHA